MEHTRSNTPSPANVPTLLPPPSGFLPTLAHLNTNLAQGNSPGDALAPPVPSFPSQSPASYANMTSSHTHNSPTAGRSPSDSIIGSPNEAGRSPHSDVTHIGSATQQKLRSIPGLESQVPNLSFSPSQSTVDAFRAYQTQDSNITYAGPNTQAALDQLMGPQLSPSQTSTAQYWVSQNIRTNLPPADEDGEPELHSPEDIDILPPAGQGPTAPNTLSHTHALSNTSMWSHVTHESISDISQTRDSVPPMPALSRLHISFEKLLANPILYTPSRPKEYMFAFDQEEIDSMRKGLKDLNNQLTTDVGEIAVSYGAYYLKAPILLHAELDILTPTTPPHY